MNKQNFQGRSSSPFGREILVWLIGLFIFIFTGLLFSGIIPLFAWVEPTQMPPGGNVAAPINVSDLFQTKYGALHIVGNSSNYKGLSLGKGTGENALTLQPGENLIYGRVSLNSSPEARFLSFITCGDMCISSSFEVTVGQGVRVGMPFQQPNPGPGDLNAVRLCIQGDCRDSWSGVGGGTPGGSNTQVQFNDAGVFGGDTGFTYDKTTDYATLAGGLISPYLLGSVSGRGNLTLGSTSSTANKGKIFFGNSAYDEENNRLGIGTISPGYKLAVVNTNPNEVPIINLWDNSSPVQWTGLRLARGGTVDGTEKWFIGTSNFDDRLRIRRSAAIDDIVIDSLTGNIGIGGDPSAATKLNVVGAIDAGGDIRTFADIKAPANSWPQGCNPNAWQAPPCPNGWYVVNVQVDFVGRTVSVACCSL